ncbi:MAG: DUF5689 domain-containing protein [Flavobacteriales bacterium]|jgi:hypothetical protein|nr:MAG: DUF5689 domain-containing protein [Flavobacteriales bacterium]
MTRNILLFLSAAALLLASCEKELDTPPQRTLPVGEVLTVAQLRGLYSGTPKRFGGDSSVYAVVTADEQNGNLYKNVYVQDHTGGIVIRLVNSGGLYQGDSIRIYLPGTILSSYRGMLQLDSVDVDNNTVKQAVGVQKQPQLVTVAQVTPDMQGKLVRLEGVEFIQAEVGQPYADAVNQVTVNRTLSDCSANIIVRNSGYANFAGQPLPAGNGSFVAVVGQFDDDMQLFIRNIAEVQLTGDRCDPFPELCAAASAVQEDFGTTTANVDVDLDCWNNQAQLGSRFWRGTSVSGNMAVQATSFSSSNASDVSWLVTPPVTYSPGMTLSFRSQRGFGVAGHDPFALFISTNYSIGNLATANWAPLTCAYATPSTADQVWVESGAVDLGAALPPGYTGAFVVGFRYTGSGPNGQTTNFRIDDVQIQ